MSMINCAILVLFAMRAAKLMKKRSGIYLANIHSIRLSQRQDGKYLQLPFSLLCTSSHIINKFENRQINAQARTPEAVPSDPEGSCVILVPLLGWASAVSEPGSSETRKTSDRDVKPPESNWAGERKKMPEKPRGERTSFASFCPHAATLRGIPSGVCVWPTHPVVREDRHCTRDRLTVPNTGAQQMKQIEARGPNASLTSYSWQISWPR